MIVGLFNHFCYLLTYLLTYLHAYCFANTFCCVYGVQFIPSHCWAREPSSPAIYLVFGAAVWTGRSWVGGSSISVPPWPGLLHRSRARQCGQRWRPAVYCRRRENVRRIPQRSTGPRWKLLRMARLHCHHRRGIVIFFFCHQVSAKLCVRDKRTKRHVRLSVVCVRGIHPTRGMMRHAS